MDKPLSNHDLERLMKDMDERANILESKDIKAHHTIEDIFKGKGHAILFNEYPGEEIGHWTIMVRHHNKANNNNNAFSKQGQIYYFDSFGDKPSNKNIETVVLKTYPELLYNDHPFQLEDSNACGRHCLMVAALNKLGYSPHQIEDVLLKKFKKAGSMDEFVIKTIR
jgi:hypothetical protein